MKHDFCKCGQDDCYACSRGLAICQVCQAGEGELTTDCPGKPVAYDLRQAVYDGTRDFVGGAWVDKKVNEVTR